MKYNNEMNIAVTIDDNYVKPLIVMLTSLFETNSCCKFHIFLIHSNLSKLNIEKINGNVRLYNQKISIIQLDDSLFETATSVEHVTKETFYRLLLAEILPTSLDRILYLDPDIIINGNIEKFYDKDFKGNLAVAAQVATDDSYYKKEKKRLGIPLKATYFNAGVILFNLTLMRNSEIFKKETMIKYVVEHNKDFSEGDQSCLNALLWDKVIIVNCNLYNYDTRYYFSSKNRNLKFVLSNLREQSNVKRKTLIIHYRGASKPWHNNYSGKMWRAYWRYESKTEYRRNFFKYFIINKYNNIKDYVKGSILSK